MVQTCSIFHRAPQNNSTCYFMRRYEIFQSHKIITGAPHNNSRVTLNIHGLPWNIYRVPRSDIFCNALQQFFVGFHGLFVWLHKISKRVFSFGTKQNTIYAFILYFWYIFKFFMLILQLYKYLITSYMKVNYDPWNEYLFLLSPDK